MTTAPAVQTSPSEGQPPAKEFVSHSREFMIQIQECFSNEFERRDCWARITNAKGGDLLEVEVKFRQPKV